MSFLKNLLSAFTPKERAIFLSSAAIAAASFFAVIGIVIAQSTRMVPAPGGTYRPGLVGQPEYVNPVTARSEADLELVKLVYPNVADVADQITSSPGGRTWTVHLKSGLTWQDGAQLTSDDIIFTVQSIQNPDADSPLATAWQGVTANRVSELEVQFKLANPYAFFADDLSRLYIVPKHLFADVPPGNWRLSDYTLKPVGAGPYEFVSYNQGADGFITDYKLKAWGGYAGSHPLIPNLDFAFFRNTTDLINAFNAGQIDGFGGATNGDLAAIDRPYQLLTWRTPGYYAVFFNQSKNLALQDPAVRAALSMTVDRNALVSQALDGHGVPDYGPIPPDAPYYAPVGGNPISTSTPNQAPGSSSTASGTPETPLDAAAALLTQAGWNISSSTGFRTHMIQQTAVPLAVNLTVPDIGFLVRTAQALQNEWSSLGAQVTIATDTTENIVANDIRNRNYESLLFGNVLGPNSDLFSFWDSSQRFSPGLNLAIYQNKSVDALVEDARQNMSDASRTAEFAAAQADIVADTPAVFLYSPDYLYVAANNVRGVSTQESLGDPSDIAQQMAGWYLDTARVLK